MTHKICMLVINAVTNDPRVRREAETFVRAGYQVVVIGIRTEGSSPEEWMDGYQVVRIPLPRLHRRKRVKPPPISPPEWIRKNTSPRIVLAKLRADVLNIGFVIWINLVMARAAAKNHADMYHAHDLNALLAGFLASRWKGKKLVYDFHELFTEQYRAGVKTPLWGKFFGLLERVLAKRADLRVTVCESIAEFAAERYGLAGVITVRNAPPYQAVPIGMGSPGREKIILYHGGYSRDRGLEQFIESARFLRSGRVMLRGFGDLESDLRLLVKERGLEDRISFAPPVPMMELVRTARSADIGVIPYIGYCLNNRFCLPNKLFEYMMAGLAVGGSDLPELRRIILGQNLGVVFNPEDPEDIARALNRLLEDEGRLEEMKRNALAAARTLYNWEAESEKLLKGYQSLTLACAP
jgi:glycogen(starch) synthase